MAEFSVNAQALMDITDLELVFGTTKLLPDFEQVPDEFKIGNVYTRLLDCMFANMPIPAGTVAFRPGFDDPETPKHLVRVIEAHLQSFEPKHQHKIAGLAYLVSLVCKIDPA